MDRANPEASVKTVAVDTHCHLFLLSDPGDAVARAREAGVDTMVCVGIDPQTSRRSVEFAESYRGVFATAGMHPHDATAFDERAGAEIEELLANPLVVGVGECGLDFYRMRSPRQDQERVLRVHVALAREADLPLIVHVREAWPEILRVLDEGSAERVVFHCFSGDAALAKEVCARGWFVSFAANITYPKNAHLREAASVAAPDQILVETDSPFLAPQRMRGRDNAPANVVDVIAALAEARGVETSHVQAVTSANARRVFPRLR